MGCSPQGLIELDMTERLTISVMGWTSGQCSYMQRDSLGVRATVSPDGA